MSNLKTRLEKLEDKTRSKQREYGIVVYQGKEAEAEEKKKKILEKDPNAKFWEIHVVWAK